MIKKLKKGFTLVELIVVIAIIAILSTVAVIGFTRVVDKANVSNDTQLVRNLNERMQLEEAATGYKKPETAHEAFVLTEDFGFIIEKLTPTSSGNDIVWDMTTNRFALIDAEDHKKVVYSDPTITLSTNPIDLWKVYKEVPIREDQKYSIYLAGTNLNGSVDAKVGVDVGRNTEITEIAYTNPSGDKQEVVIRTNGGVLAVNGPQDTVTHYGFATIVNVDDVKVGTYNEAGTVGRLIYSDNSGAIKFKSTAEVYCYMNISTDAGADANDNTKEAGATVYTNVNAGEQTTAHGYVEGDGKSAVTVTNGIVAVNTCPNHNTDYGVVVVGNREYILCKCCGGFSLYEDGNKIELPAGDPSKSAEIGSGAQSNFDYTSPNHEHSYSEAWSHDEANHWHICEGCDEISSLATHTIAYSNITGDTHDEYCAVCGYSKTAVAHTFVDGICACGKEEVTAPVEVHLTGVVGYANQSDHYTDSNTLIGTWDEINKLTYYNNQMLVHTLTVTYTIPADTPANATIICDPVTEWSELLEGIWPGAGFGYTYKIVNNSSHVFNIKETNVHSDVVEAISKSNAIVKVGSYYKVLKNDGTYFDLDQRYIPNMTTCSYFNNYITWLKNSGATTQSSATTTFMREYYNTFANSSYKSFYYYLDTQVVQNGTSWDEILDVLCGTPDWFSNKLDYKYVECELIRLMMKFSYEKAFGFVFVQNTVDGWENGAYEKILNNNKKVNFGTGFFGWDTCEPTTLKAYNFLELCEDGATLNYLKNGNTISGGIACLWHAYAGNAWQGVTLCDAPQFTIVLEAN